MPKLPHIKSLDGLRGIAIILVLIHHYFAKAPSVIGDVANSLWIGVDLFFVLSGFLITRILLATKNNEYYFRNFYVRRALRIFPIYYLVLMVVFFFLKNVDLFQIEERIFPWSYLFYVSNYVSVTESGWLGGSLLPTWSLAVEEQFYLLWPFIVYKVSTKNLIRVCFIFISFALCCRGAFMFLDNGWGYAYMFLPTRIDTLCMGALLALAEVREDFRNKLNRSLPLLAVLSIVAISVFFLKYGYLSRHRLGWPVMYNAIGIVFTWWVWKLVNKPAQRIMTGRLLVLLGKYSYAMYLIHVFVLDVFLSVSTIHENRLFYFPVYVVCLVAFAYFSWIVFEQPILRLKKYFPSA